MEHCQRMERNPKTSQTKILRLLFHLPISNFPVLIKAVKIKQRKTGLTSSNCLLTIYKVCILPQMIFFGTLLGLATF